jgi:hypothetical protein
MKVAAMGDCISRAALLAAYDAAHVGPPGGARKLIEEAPAVAVPEWISVEERLPKPHETVLVIRRNQRKKLSVECGYYMGNGDWQVGTRLTRPVTHWMPLPELPKEG